MTPAGRTLWHHGMRWATLALVVSSAACSRTSGPPSAPVAAASSAPPSARAEPGPPARPPGPVRLGAAVGIPIVVDRGMFWPAPDGPRLLAEGATVPRRVDESERADLLGQRPARQLRVGCSPRGCGPHGTGKALFLQDGARERLLADGLHEVHGAEVIGAHAYWVTFGPYGARGDLSRVPTAGGRVERLWAGSGIHAMLVDGTDVYFVSDAEVVWFDTSTSRAHVIAAAASQRSRLVLHGDRLYWAELGEPRRTSAPSGAVRSAPRHGGAVTTHADAVKWPTLLCVDDTRVYFGREDGSELYAVPLEGGEIETVVDLGPGLGGIMWAHPTGAGMLVMRGDRLAIGLGHPADLWLVPTAR